LRIYGIEHLKRFIKKLPIKLLYLAASHTASSENQVLDFGAAKKQWGLLIKKINICAAKY
jgi:hypothetical protein